MSDPKTPTTEEQSETSEATEASTEQKRSFSELLRNVVLAGVGAVVATQEEIKEFVGILVEKGELAENEGKKLVRDFLDRRKKKPKEAAEVVESTLENRIDSSLERVLHSINIPTKGDVEELKKRIEALSGKFDALLERIGARVLRLGKEKTTAT